MPETFPPRLHVALAAQSPRAVVFRRGPSRRVATFLWDRQTDTFSLGQWLKGRIYERRADISPDGRYLIYFAMNGRWQSETRGSWTAVSRAPWLKAIELHRKGDCWEGGGLFLTKNTYWLNDRYHVEDMLKTSKEVRCVTEYRPEGGYGGTVKGLRFNAEDTGVYYRRLLRDGWTFREYEHSIRFNTAFFEKELTHGWMLQKLAHEGPPRYKGKGCYWDEHMLINSQTGEERIGDDWEWAERDGADLVYASRGSLYRCAIENERVTGSPRLLYEFHDCTFERRTAPY